MPLVIVRYPKRQIRSLQYFLQEKNNLVLGGIFLFPPLACYCAV